MFLLLSCMIVFFFEFVSIGKDGHNFAAIDVNVYAQLENKAITYRMRSGSSPAKVVFFLFRPFGMISATFKLPF